MDINSLTKEEKDNIVKDITRGDYKYLNDLLEFLKPFIKNVYKNEIRKEFVMSKEEFKNEIVVVLCKRIKGIKGQTFGQLINFAESIIKSSAKDIAEKYKRNCHKYVFVENLEIMPLIQAEINLSDSVEEQAIKRIANGLIKRDLNKILTDSQKKTLKIMIEEDNLREYAKREGKDYGKLRGERKSLVKKIRKHEKLRLHLNIM